MENGFGSPFVRVYYGDTELSSRITMFRYTYAEAEDDSCELTIETDSINEPDEKFYQQKAKLKVNWGYINSPLQNTRIVYVQDVRWSFEKELITVKLICTDKAVSLKFSSSNRMMKSPSLLHAAGDYAKIHGLKPYVYFNSEEFAKGDLPSFLPTAVDLNIPTIPGEDLTQFFKRQKAISNLNQKINITRATKDRAQLIEDMRKQSAAYNKRQKELENAGSVAGKSDPKYKKFPLSPEFLAATLEEKKRNAYINSLPRITKDLVGPALSQSDELRLISNNKEFGVKNAVVKAAGFKMYPEYIPQAGKSDKQLLDQMAAAEPGGPYVVEGRDDMLIIRKRNYNQKPYKSYTYGGEEGNLLSFSPETKNYTNSGSATDMGYGGWDAENKAFYSGSTNAAVSSVNSTIAKFTKLRNEYIRQTQINPGRGNLVTGTQVDIEKQTERDSYSFGPNFIITKPITVNQKILALDKTITEFSADARKMLYDPRAGGNMGDSFARADNRRNNAALQNNPATATIIGDPNLEVGIVITLVRVSKKFSGNYYVTKSEHVIDVSSGYMTEIEIMRDGTNLKNIDSNTNNEVDLGKVVNKEIGTTSIEPKTITLEITKNKR